MSQSPSLHSGGSSESGGGTVSTANQIQGHHHTTLSMTPGGTSNADFLKQLGVKYHIFVGNVILYEGFYYWVCL